MSLAADLETAVFDRVPQRAVSIVDAHAHVGPYSEFFIPQCEPADLVRVMDRCGVDRAVLSSHLAIQLDARSGNEATAAAVAAHPDQLAGYLVVNPWQNPAEELARWGDDPRFVGVKLHPDLHAYPLTGSRYAPVWEFAERSGCLVLTHTWTGSPFDDPKHLGMVADRHPEVVLLAGHAGALPEGFDQAIEVAAAHPRVLLEICGSYHSGATITRMVRALGASKVVFGSDFPFIDLRYSLGRLIFADLDTEDRIAVLGGNASRLFAWRGRPPADDRPTG
ncbi:amidohydrolase family protein [Plantactinospora mayteni]|uniref:Amidohydrolase n=1 Tax=Plantactinospora mayteni TaxID=566021 RepID=A0ABQ4ERI0_9ACTN|nr:amidohydrolase family protein [Plantactinospora mayteni]GIG97241.1 amidohydrolase [Plantactinospora mayteni]